MYKSKLQICLEILCNLVSKGPMKLTQMTKYVELDKVRLIEHLRLLKSRGLIGKEVLGENNILYFVTERGLKVLKVTSQLSRRRIRSRCTILRQFRMHLME